MGPPPPKVRSSASPAPATVLEWPAGHFLVIAVGIGIIALGFHEPVVADHRGRLMDRVDPPRSPRRRGTIDVSGRVADAAFSLVEAKFRRASRPTRPTISQRRFLMAIGRTPPSHQR